MPSNRLASVTLLAPLLIAPTLCAQSEPPVSIDLSPAIFEPLVFSQIMDEGSVLQPREGSRFVAIPFRYATDTTYDLRRTSFDIHPMPPAPVKFIGFRAMIWNDGRAEFSRRANDPLYERLQVTQAELGAPASVVGINQTRPVAQQRTPNTKNRLARSGWAAVIFELPGNVDNFTIAAAGAPAQEVRVSLLEFASKCREGAKGPNSPELARWIRAIGSNSPATVRLGIQCLTTLRQDVSQNDYARWAVPVDAAIIDAIAQLETEARRDAWAGLVRFGPMPPESRDAINASDPHVQLNLVEAIRGEFTEPSPGSYARTNALAALAAILRSSDSDVGRAAVDLFASGAPDEAFDCLITASPTVRTIALEKCKTLDDASVRRRMVHALAVQAGPNDAAALGELIKRDRIIVADPNDPILIRLRDAESDKSRQSLISMLNGISLVPVLRSPTLASIFDDLSDDDAPELLRRSVAELASDQVRLRSAAARTGEFPMRYPPQFRDPVRTVLHRTTLRGPDELRVESVAAMLREGNALDAFEDIRAAFSGKSSDRLAFIQALAARPNIERIDAVFALLMRILSLADPDSALPVLQTLDRLARQRGEREAVSVNLAAKAGLSWESLADFSLSPDPKLAALASKWIFRLAHLSPQDRRQFLAASDRDARAVRLNSASTRLARIVAGNYDLVFIVELAWPVPTSGPQSVAAWLPPQRLTLSGGVVEMKTRDAGRDIQLYVNDKLRGFGTAQVGSAGMQAPENWLPHLEPADENSLLAGLSIPGASSPPLVMASGDVDSSSRPGTLKMEITDLLRQAITSDPAAASLAQSVDQVIPANLSITLRYAGMGSYIGIAARRSINTPPPSPSAPPVLINYAVLLERSDASDSPPASADLTHRAAATVSPQYPASNPR